jgi:hypothetical protein
VCRAALLLAAVVAVGAGCGGHARARTKAKPAARIHVQLAADSHRPRVGKPWHYEVRVTDPAGNPVPARVHLQILFGGAPVGQIGRHRVANGIWQETIGADGNEPFPARARGVRLVFEAIVTAKGETRRAHWWIQVG